MSHHNEKLASVIEHELNLILVRDFNFGGAIVTILDATVSKDNLKARVRLGIIPYIKEVEAFMEIKKREREIRHKILKNTRLRAVPKLFFEIVQEQKTETA